MIKHFPVSNIYSVYTHILTSITISITMYISVICFKTVNASGNLCNISCNSLLDTNERWVKDQIEGCCVYIHYKNKVCSSTTCKELGI